LSPSNGEKVESESLLTVPLDTYKNSRDVTEFDYLQIEEKVISLTSDNALSEIRHECRVRVVEEWSLRRACLRVNF
jgi:hypothetical protein